MEPLAPVAVMRAMQLFGKGFTWPPGKQACRQPAATYAPGKALLDTMKFAAAQFCISAQGISQPTQACATCWYTSSLVYVKSALAASKWSSSTRRQQN